MVYIFDRYTELLNKHNKQPLFKRKYMYDSPVAIIIRMITGLLYVLLMMGIVNSYVFDQSIFIIIISLFVEGLVLQYIPKYVHYLVVTLQEKRNEREIIEKKKENNY